MQIEILTKEELQKFKSELIQDIKQAIQLSDSQPKQWLRSSEVRRLLKISLGTLQNLRIKGILPYEKIKLVKIRFNELISVESKLNYMLVKPFLICR